MPRYKAKIQEPPIDFGELAEALKELSHGKSSIRSIAAAYGIPFSNLTRYAKKIKAENVDIKKTTDAELINKLKLITKRGAKTV